MVVQGLFGSLVAAEVDSTFKIPGPGLPLKVERKEHANAGGAGVGGGAVFWHGLHGLHGI